MFRVDHIGILVDSIDEAKHFLGETLGLTITFDFVNPTSGDMAAYFQCGDVQIEVIELADSNQRRVRLGDGVEARIEHIALKTSDLNLAADQLSRKGVRGRTPAPIRMANGVLTLFTEPRTTDGVLYQLLGE
jgi:methylmalonyl-CoA/ethylmalonyl-CoA epimerase